MKPSISTAEYKQLLGIDTPKKNKYGAVGVWACPLCFSKTMKNDSFCHPGKKPIYFSSTGEYKYWLELLLLQKTGVITGLERQTSFDIEVNDVYIGKYTADFKYSDCDGNKLIADFKGVDTDSSKLRRKLVYALYGIEVLIVR